MENVVGALLQTPDSNAQDPIDGDFCHINSPCITHHQHHQRNNPSTQSD